MKFGRPQVVDDGVQISVRVERSLVDRADALKSSQVVHEVGSEFVICRCPGP